MRPIVRRPFHLAAAAVGLAAASLIGMTQPEPAHAYCYESIVMSPRPYQGNHGERIELLDGSVWRDSSYRYDYRYEYYPTVTVCPSEGTLQLRNDDPYDVWRLR